MESSTPFMVSMIFQTNCHVSSPTFISANICTHTHTKIGGKTSANQRDSPSNKTIPITWLANCWIWPFTIYCNDLLLSHQLKYNHTWRNIYFYSIVVRLNNNIECCYDKGTTLAYTYFDMNLLLNSSVWI